ncbi:hypothetical protein KIH86_10790, partial [Paenibacillus sp. HN-1]
MFTVSSGGYNTRHAKTFLMSRPKGLSKYLLLLLKSETRFEIAGRTFTANPNCAIIIERNTPYQYYCPDGNYVDDWLHFDCTHDEFFRNNHVAFNEAIPLGNPARFTLYIQQIL